ncbi:hypothetical protein PISMIDRAFT_671871 [Pisolithus microcarpus 441]|uniref:Uncharacterized protein n=1 Tax=Pisolithus microcarpus 441 TaxID=765257 RepID=A0A0C9ZV42_9AGAM|nr:hypothetical protein PISMIDRAFT_671871 [Pisolithus microcarpus 441]
MRQELFAGVLGGTCPRNGEQRCKHVTRERQHKLRRPRKRRVLRPLGRRWPWDAQRQAAANRVYFSDHP